MDSCEAAGHCRRHRDTWGICKSGSESFALSLPLTVLLKNQLDSGKDCPPAVLPQGSLHPAPPPPGCAPAVSPSPAPPPATCCPPELTSGGVLPTGGAGERIDPGGGGRSFWQSTSRTFLCLSLGPINNGCAPFSEVRAPFPRRLASPFCHMGSRVAAVSPGVLWSCQSLSP